MNFRPAMLLALAALLAGTAQADTGRDWLARMGAALNGTSYAGEFTCESAGRKEQLRIVHRVRGGRVNERLTTLAANGRELVRNGEEVVVYLPDRQLAIIERRPGRGDLLGSLPQFQGDLGPWYEVRVVGREAALLGPATIVAVQPVDDYRFGYRLWIDEASAMPVRSELQDSAGRVVERLRFTALQIGADIPDAAFEPAVDRSALRWIRQAPQAVGTPPAWQAGQVPPGFRLSLSGLQAMGGARGPVSHLVYSDGLASISVFIEEPAQGSEMFNGSGRAGAASAFSTTVGGHQVTAIGEVPPATLRIIANGLRPAADAPR